jgi:oligopeptide/dipeptide ABC transporter ATP-binding protein
MDKRPLLLEVEDLKTHIFLDEGTVRAVDGTSFFVRRGETLGVVGESGCGKSITARSVLRIVRKPGRIVEGKILWHRTPASNGNGSPKKPDSSGKVIDLTTLPEQGEEMRYIRGGEIAMVFQEPMSSLSPVHTIGDQIMEVILLHQHVSHDEARQKTLLVLDQVGMPQPKRLIDRYPHQLSGGMRQRAMIAMALSCHPDLLIADEPTTALDVTTEAQILSLMRTLQRDLGMAIMFITHNLGVVAQMTERVIVMYMGRVVEEASVDDLFYNAKHPYSQALLRSIPKMGSRTAGESHRLASIRGTVPDPFNLPPGCPYHPRCDYATRGLCDVEDPPLIQVGVGHSVKCHMYMDKQTLIDAGKPLPSAPPVIDLRA